MSEEQLKAFLQLLKADSDLQAELKKAVDVNAVVAIAKAAGFVISAEALMKWQMDLSDEDLESVAGGKEQRATACYEPMMSCPETGREYCRPRKS